MTCQTVGQVYKMCKVYHIFRQHLHYKHWNGEKNRIYGVLHIDVSHTHTHGQTLGEKEKHVSHGHLED